MPFAKHETFHIRDGWLYKGLRAVDEDPTVFLNPNATARLGLGKNMVRSLRFWMQATGLTQESFSQRVRVQKISDLGQAIYRHDPYLELDGSLWLIHHGLVCSHAAATAWYWFFNHYAPIDFTRREFIERLMAWNTTQPGEADAEGVAESSLRKDFDCLIHTYLPNRRERDPEDQIESPLTALNLFSAFEERDEETRERVHRYRYQQPAPANIPPLIFLYILLSRQQAQRPTSTQVSLTAALREPMNAGRTFNIGLSALETLLSKLEDSFPHYAIHLARAGNLDLLTLPAVAPTAVLNDYFEERIAIEGRG